MRSFRRPPRPAVREVDAAVRGVVDLPTPVPGAGGVDPDPGEVTSLSSTYPTGRFHVGGVWQLAWLP